jgi:hypothetical protein
MIFIFIPLGPSIGGSEQLSALIHLIEWSDEYFLQILVFLAEYFALTYSLTAYLTSLKFHLVIAALSYQGKADAEGRHMKSP